MLIVEDGSVNNGEVFVDDSSLLTGDEVYNDDDGHENTNEEGEEQDDSVTEPRVPDASRTYVNLQIVAIHSAKIMHPRRRRMILPGLMKTFLRMTRMRLRRKMMLSPMSGSQV